MSINRNEFTKAQVEKAMQCKTADELVALAKAEGFDIAKEEAEAYMAELADFELDGDELKNAAGGGCYTECNSECPYHCQHDIYPG